MIGISTVSGGQFRQICSRFQCRERHDWDFYCVVSHCTLHVQSGFSAANGMIGISTLVLAMRCVPSGPGFSAANGMIGISTQKDRAAFDAILRCFSAANGMIGISTPLEMHSRQIAIYPCAANGMIGISTPLGVSPCSS